MSSSMWKLEKDLCRCCHAEGSYKNLAEPCFQLGQEEIYFDMLQECLDIKIVPMTGDLREITYTICETCVVRLRDASNFKRQVQDCEERFKDLYSRNLIKAFNVKEEPIALSDNEDYKQEFHSMDDDDDTFMKYDDDDDLEDSQSLAELEKMKGKSRAKPKPKPKPKQPVKKVKVKKSIKEEKPEVTEPAASGEKKKGYTQFTLAAAADGSLAFTCDTCGSSFKKRNHFSQHYRHVHLKLRPKLRSCYLCSLKVPAHMRAFHLESVHGWPAPSCGACGKKFAYPFQVLKHQKTYHMGEKSYKCDQCDMKFASKYRLEQHSIKHTTQRKHKCSFCGKAFRWRNNLKTHVMIHLGDKAHRCTLCDAAFVQQSSLKYHLGKKHPECDETESKAVCTVEQDADGLWVFTCIDCGREYYTKGNFMQHYKHIHLKLRPKTWPCPVCGIPLLPYKRAEHLETAHGRPAPTCNICGKKFTAQHFMLRHQRVVHMGQKLFNCDQCAKAFPDLKYLRRHMVTHTDEKNYPCELCGKRFKHKKNVQTHMDMHLNIRRHICAVCGDAFVQLSSLKYHMGKRHPEKSF